MKKIILIVFLFISTCLFSQQIDTLYILQTTDVHGRIYPYDYFNDQPAKVGFAQVYSRIKRYRAKYNNVILVDAGDVLQGTPLAYYFNKIETDKPNPLILTMNRMDYDAFTVGNHEIEQGVAVYTRAEKESDFPWLSANAELDDGTTFFKPYTIVKEKGFLIGIIGLTTPGIPTMLDTTYYPGITWKDMVEIAQKFATILFPRVDILVGLFHSGFNANEDAYKSEKLDLPVANASGLVADKIPEFDIVFGGHSHKIVPNDYKQGSKYMSKEKNLNKPLRINSGCWAKNLGVARLILEQVEGTWKIIDKDGWGESVEDGKKALEVALQIEKQISLNLESHKRWIYGN